MAKAIGADGMTRRTPKTSATHVALLRGVNVGGKNRLPMAELAEYFRAADCAEVETFIQSGNVVFRASASGAQRAVKSVEASLLAKFGHPIPVVLRTALELAAIVRANPFAGPKADPKVLSVQFLRDPPSAASCAALDPKRSPPDEIRAIGSEVYLRCPNGVARTRFTNDYFDRTLGTVTTARNWKSVLALLDLATK